jgi:hypothetical protein
LHWWILFNPAFGSLCSLIFPYQCSIDKLFDFTEWLGTLELFLILSLVPEAQSYLGCLRPTVENLALWRERTHSRLSRVGLIIWLRH